MQSGYVILNQKNLRKIARMIPSIKEWSGMQNTDLVELIDQAIIDIWKNKIQADYENHWLLGEDSLKCALYFHLRNRLENVLEENNLRIYTEYTGNPFSCVRKRPDMVIVRSNREMNSQNLGKSDHEVIAVIEIKFKNGFTASDTIYNDYEKMKYYVQNLNLNAKFYMVTIWEYEDDTTTWARKNAAWAKGRLTELNASYVRNAAHKEIQFYVYPH